MLSAPAAVFTTCVRYERIKMLFLNPPHVLRIIELIINPFKRLYAHRLPDPPEQPIMRSTTTVRMRRLFFLGAEPNSSSPSQKLFGQRMHTRAEAWRPSPFASTPLIVWMQLNVILFLRVPLPLALKWGPLLGLGCLPKVPETLLATWPARRLGLRGHKTATVGLSCQFCGGGGSAVNLRCYCKQVAAPSKRR